MKYRLICILNKSSIEMGLDIEVCLDTGSRTLSPFQRKITLSELLKSEGGADNKLVQLLFQIGLEHQPFKLSVEQLCHPKVKDIINNHEWIYLHNGGRNKTLKRVSSLASYLPVSNNSCEFKEGVVVGGELYVVNIHNWWNNILVRFRYDDTSMLFPSVFSDVPIQSNSGHWIKRNHAEEEKLLLVLGDYLDCTRSLLNLGNDAEVIKTIVQSGWSLFVPKNSKSNSKVTIQSDKSGIEWFSTVNGPKNIVKSEMILNAYLTNRNFIESNGEVQLFMPQTIKHLSPIDVTDALVGNLDVDNLYAQPIKLNVQEKKRIKQVVELKVKAILKPYQMEGVYWLALMRKKRTGCMLADDMGLGKTLQVLAYLTTFTSPGTKHLVICPASLTSNWENEIIKFTSHILSNIDIASYEAVRLHPEQYVHEYDTLIVDEGQMVKNDSTQRHQVILKLSRKHTIILSGTPIENSIKEIWSQFQLLIPESTIIEKKILSMGIQVDMQRWCELSRVLLSPFILRRTKDEVLKNLPILTEEDVYVDLSTKERVIYQSILETFKMAIETGVSGRITSIALEGLLRLRQCCVSVNLLPKYLTNSGYVNSTKMEFSLKLIKNLILENHKILVFSQFTSALDELNDLLKNHHIEALYLTGATRNRQTIVNKFQGNMQYFVFLISLKAGGTGLNLTAADRVIFLDDWWNPAVESQAFSRAHRIGQKNTVEVYRLICKNTIEEKILELHKNKKEISDIFNRGEGNLTIEDIKDLLI